MGAHKRVDFSERDKKLLYLLYKHRYCDFTALTMLNIKYDTLYRRLKKLIKSGYVKKLNSENIKIEIYSLTQKGENWLTQNIEQEFNKPVLSKLKMSSLYNFNHHILIARIGALLANRNIDYEIDLTCKKAYPKLKIIPDIIIERYGGLIGFEIELEYKTAEKYAKKLSQLQTSEEIKKLIYLTQGKPDKLQNKISIIDQYKNGASIDERLITYETKNKIMFMELNNFIQNIDDFIS